jgi:large subunit ribosomal protein L9
MKSMKVILRSDVKGLGKKGESVNVAEGYARNYLLPKGLAVPASEGSIREAALIQDARLKKATSARQKAASLADRMQGLSLTIAARTGEAGKLYGAVTSKDIAQELERILGEAFDKRKIELPEPIKSLGAYPVAVRLHPGMVITVQVQVIPKLEVRG